MTNDDTSTFTSVRRTVQRAVSSLPSSQSTNPSILRHEQRPTTPRTTSQVSREEYRALAQRNACGEARLVPFEVEDDEWTLLDDYVMVGLNKPRKQASEAKVGASSTSTPRKASRPSAESSAHQTEGKDAGVSREDDRPGQ